MKLNGRIEIGKSAYLIEQPLLSVNTSQNPPNPKKKNPMNNFKTLCNYNQKSLSEKKILFLTLVCTIPTNVFDI